MNDHPHVVTHDYNGAGAWSVDGVRDRYAELARRFHVSDAVVPTPREQRQGNVCWIHPVMDAVIAGIERGDAACIEIGVAFVESGHKQPMGKLLHSNTARALRRAKLAPGQVERLRARILAMLVAGQVPHEYKQYAKLLRRIGLGEAWKQASSRADRGNPYVMRYVRYFEECALEEAARRSP